VLLCSNTDNRHKFCAKVADFGLARDLGVVSRVETRTYGTLTHMAPEVLTSDFVSKVGCFSPLHALHWSPICFSWVLAPAQPSSLQCSQSSKRMQWMWMWEGSFRSAFGGLKGCVCWQSVDVYSFGVILWEMYCGQRAWAGLNTAQVISQLTWVAFILMLAVALAGFHVNSLITGFPCSVGHSLSECVPL